MNIAPENHVPHFASISRTSILLSSIRRVVVQCRIMNAFELNSQQDLILLCLFLEYGQDLCADIA